MRLIALTLLVMLLAGAGITLWLSPWTYAAQDRVQISDTASKQHPAGTDELGRDRLVRSAAALLLDGAGAAGASAVASALAVALGLVAAFGPAWLGRSLIYLGDLFLTLPWIFLLMMVRAAMPLTMAPAQSAAVTFLLLGLLGGPVFLRVHAARLMGLRRAEWLLQAHAAGLRPMQQVRYLLPHLRPILLTQFALYIPACIIAEANLGTLGLGVGEPLASWGSMVQSLQNSVFLGSSSLIYVPIVLLIAVLISLELLVFDTGVSTS